MMKARAFVWSALLLVLALPNAARAGALPEVKDPAEVLPEQTLFYAELWDNPQLIKEIQELLKGSSLEDMPAAIARFHEKLGAKDHDFSASGVGIAGVALSPEVFGEIGRIRGWSFAITSVSKTGEPTFVSVLLTGDSQLVPLMFRTYLCVTDGIRSVGEVDGVKIYQDKSAGKKTDKPRPDRAPGADKPAVPAGGPIGGPINPQDILGKTEFCIAMTPGMVVFGSTPDSVKDVLTRASAKTKGASLAKSKGFQTAAKLREGGGGLFFYADMDLIGKQMEEFAKGPNAAEWDAVRSFINPKAFHAVAGTFMMRKGGIDLRVQVNVDVKDAGPLVDLMPDKPANLQLLQYLPKDSLFAAAVALPEGAKRWEKLLMLADTAAKASNSKDPLPSKEVEKLEAALGIKVGKDIFGKIEGFAIGASGRGDLPKGGDRLPILVIEATSVDAAGSLEDLIPKLIGFATKGETPKPTSDQVEGQKVFTIPAEGLPWKTQLCFGHRSKVLVIAQDRKMVAECLNNGGDKKGLLSEAKVAAAVKEFDQPIVASLWMVGETIRFGMKEYASAVPSGSGSKRDDKFDEEMAKLVDKLPPMLFSLTAKSDHITYEMRQPSMKGVSAKLIDLLVDKGLEEASKETTKPKPDRNPREDNRPDRAPPK